MTDYDALTAELRARCAEETEAYAKSWYAREIALLAATTQIAEMAQAHADEHPVCAAPMRYILDRCGHTE